MSLLLPPITLYEIEEIKCFISFYRSEIIDHEILILDNLITLYQQNRTKEIREELKSFLLYLRRSVCPTPTNTPQKFRDPEGISFDQSFDPYKLQEDYIYSKATPKQVRRRKNQKEVIYECSCKSCRRVLPPKRNSSFLKFKKTLESFKRVVVRDK